MDHLPLVLCLVAFLVTFVVTRAITRLIRAGVGPFQDNVSSSGVHVHHAVPGLILLVIGAFTAVGSGGQAGWAELAGVLVGIGTSLVLDEFALILHLDDVYWSAEGRLSVEMVALATAVLGLAVLGFRPFRLEGNDGGWRLVVAVVTIVMHLVWVVMCALKGKYRLGLFATFIPLLGPVGGIRIARPNSWWAKRFYSDSKQERSAARAAAFDEWVGQRFGRFADLSAGSVTETAEVEARQ